MYDVQVANTAKLSISVRSARGSTTVRYWTNGRYVSLPVNTLTNTLTGQPLQPNSNAQAFWGSVLDIVENDITGHT